MGYIVHGVAESDTDEQLSIAQVSGRRSGGMRAILTGEPGLSSVGFEKLSLGKVLISTAGATRENRLLLSQDSINLLLLILLKKMIAYY